MTSLIPQRHRARRLALTLVLAAVLYFAYLLAYSGIFRSDDEQYIIDTTASFAIRSGPDRLLLNETVYLRGLQTTDVEPAQPILAVPLYWLAYHVPWIGNVHAIYLFNPIVASLTAILLFYYALDLGYQERTALVAALLFGLTTIVWPYTKTFFREPLTMLNLFAAAFFVNRWRHAFSQHRRDHWWWLALGIVTIVLALLSKEAAFIALPFFLVLGFPRWDILTRRYRELFAIGLGLVVLALGLRLAIAAYRLQWEAITLRYLPLLQYRAFVIGLPKSWYATLGYLFSPARGVFWYSPVLVLALGGPLVVSRSRWRETWLPLALVLIFAVSYAAIKGELWHGGAGWGPRYMVPLTPFLMLASLPLLQAILESRALPPKLILVGLAAGGFLIQLGSVYVYLHDYYSHQQSITGLTPWQDNITWSVFWSQAIGSLLFAPEATPDIYWLYPRQEWLVIGVVLAAAVLVIVSLLWLNRRTNPPVRVFIGMVVAASALVLGVTSFALLQAYDDPRYEGHNQELHALRVYLADHAQPDDVVFLATPRYTLFFMNYYKAAPIWYSLPVSPGERYNEEDTLAVESDRVEDLVHPISVGMFGRAEANRGVLWLVGDHGPSLPWATRPVEWYLAKTRYTISAIDFTPLIRLVAYLPLTSPTPEDAPARIIEARLGDTMELVGYDLETSAPGDLPPHLSPGDMLGVSLLWRALTQPGADYTVATYLIDESGQVALQQDRAPVGGFEPTIHWRPGELIRDNFGFVLPDSLPPGKYELWVTVYSWPSLERLLVAGPDGTGQEDHLVLGTVEVR